ncbi:MFS transporter [Mesorhizobium koreense]|uniref:MFS transporter n=1 Tax=Mesorhizobium koreense TaxID=3074855 RepID=UPI00287B7070|nr:MFS transporter [Mesorhizobium sp. WR6]
MTVMERKEATAESAKPDSKKPGTNEAAGPSADQTVFAILAALSFSHFLNDMMQSLLPAIYPMLKTNYALSFTQVGFLTLTFQGTASLFQPVVGIVTDKRPQPYALFCGMGFTLVGLLLLSNASHYGVLIVAASLVGMGSAIFHPDASRVARMASGGRLGLAQSLFQVGGNFGSAIGPLLAAFIVLPFGQSSLAWFSLAALTAMAVLWNVGGWYKRNHLAVAKRAKSYGAPPALPHARVVATLIILGMLVFSKYIYLASLSSYYTFYLIHKFGVSVQTSQILLFVFLGAVAAGTVIGGPLGDRFGRKYVIWVSILGVLPFTLVLPHMGLVGTAILTVPIGLILASAFPAIIVYAQELLPSRVGMVAGIFFGFAFGMGGVGAAGLGIIADAKGIDFVYAMCSYLPAIGLLTVFLPNIEGPRKRLLKTA